MDAHTLVAAGMISIALGAVSGYALALTIDKPEVFRRMGVAHPGRIRQVHLDWIIMGLVLVATGLAAEELSQWATALVLAGAIVNPLLFIPLAINGEASNHPVYRAITLISFTALSTGLVAAAVCAA